MIDNTKFRKLIELIDDLRQEDMGEFRLSKLGPFSIELELVE